MKRLLMILLALAMVLGLSACNKGEKVVIDENDNRLIQYTEPAGYYLHSSNPQSAAFVKPELIDGDEDQEFTHIIEVGYQEAREPIVNTINAKKESVFEEETLMELGDNLSLHFVEMNGYQGMRIDEVNAGGDLVACTYFLIMGRWEFYINAEGTPDTMSEVRADAEAIIDSAVLEEFTFSG